MLAEFLHNLGSVKESQDVRRIRFNKTVLVIDVTLNTVFCNHPLKSEAFIELCTTPLDQIKTDVYILSYEEVKSHRILLRDKREFAHSLDEFIWTSSLLVAKGRLATNTDLTATIGVKHDADISRLEQIPYLEEIVAELTINSYPLMDISPHLNIPHKFVISFYNAALNLGLLEFNLEEKVITKKTFGGLFSKKT